MDYSVDNRRHGDSMVSQRLAADPPRSNKNFFPYGRNVRLARRSPHISFRRLPRRVECTIAPAVYHRRDRVCGLRHDLLGSELSFGSQTKKRTGISIKKYSCLLRFQTLAPGHGEKITDPFTRTAIDEDARRLLVSAIDSNHARDDHIRRQ